MEAAVPSARSPPHGALPRQQHHDLASPCPHCSAWGVGRGRAPHLLRRRSRRGNTSWWHPIEDGRGTPRSGGCGGFPHIGGVGSPHIGGAGSPRVDLTTPLYHLGKDGTRTHARSHAPAFKTDSFTSQTLSLTTESGT